MVDVTSVAASEFTPAAQKQSSKLSVSSTPVSEYDNHKPAHNTLKRQENINSVTAKSGLWWTLCHFWNETTFNFTFFINICFFSPNQYWQSLLGKGISKRHIYNPVSHYQEID